MVMRTVKQYFDDQQLLADIFGEKLQGSDFYNGLLREGYRTFSEITSDIKKGKFPERLFKLGLNCNDGMARFLINSSRDSTLEEVGAKFRELSEIENEIGLSLSRTAENIGYSLEDQNRDRKKGLKEIEIQQKYESRLHLALLVGQWAAK